MLQVDPFEALPGRAADFLAIVRGDVQGQIPCDGAEVLSRKRRAAPSFLDPHGGRVGEPTLGALKAQHREVGNAASKIQGWQAAIGP